jgi:hypothetical protein
MAKAPPLPLHGLLAEFKRPEDLLAAARAVRSKGYSRIDAFSPFPVEGLAEAIGFRENRVPVLTLIGGIAGCVLALAMQIYPNLAYPLDVGGRPLLAWPAFVLICFELTVLGAVSCAIFGMLFLNGLPRLHHPLFEVESFHFATSDKFFLAIFGNDRNFEPARTRRLLRSLAPVRIDAIRDPEQPE